MKQPRDMNILVVDDFPQSLQLFSVILKKNFFCQIKTAQNGAEAVQEAAENEFDLIFMDIQMPVMDGRTAIKRIREQPQHQDTPIIVITITNRDEKKKAMEAGATDFMLKPINPPEFISKIHYYVSQMRLYSSNKTVLN